MRTKSIFLALLASLALFAMPVAYSVELTLSAPDPDGSSVTEAAKNFAKIATAATNNEVTFKVFPSAIMYGGDSNAAVKQTSSGSIDVLVLSSSLYAPFRPRFNAIALPYVFDDLQQFRDFLSSPEVVKAFDADVSSLGIEPLGYWPRPFRVITNSKRQIKTPADLEGVKLRVPNNPLWVEFFRSLGAAPTPMAFAEVYNALQLQVVDGQENPVNIPMDNKFYEVQKYLSFTNHIADSWVVGVNKRRWASLTDAQKKALKDAVAQAEVEKVKNDTNNSAATEQFLKDKGMEVYHPTAAEQAQFVDAAKKLYPVFADLIKDKDFYEMTLKFVGKQ